MKESKAIDVFLEKISEFCQVLRVSPSALRVIVKCNVRNIGTITRRLVMPLSNKIQWKLK